MNSTTRRLLIIFALLVIGAAAGILLSRQFHLDRMLRASTHEDGSAEAATKSPGEAEAGDEASPVVPVRTAQAVRGDIVRITEVYGSVIPQPAAIVHTVLRSEVVVRHVLVQVGQEVSANDTLCEVEPSPATVAQLELARADVDSTTKLLQAAQDKQSMNLATRQEVLQAETAQHEAQLKLAQLEANLPDPSGVVTASATGRIMEVHIQAGAVVPAGAALVETLANDAIIVQLGVQAFDAAKLAAGQTISIHTIDNDLDKLEGKVRLVNAAVDPQSRLVNVLVDAPQGASLRLGQSVRGEIENRATGTLIVPRSAVLPRENEHILFVVHDGHAQMRVVQIGLQNQDAVEITSGDLKPGDEVVILGNYELTDGMAVHVENAK